MFRFDLSFTVEAPCCRDQRGVSFRSLGAGVVGAGTRQHGQHGQHGRPRRHPAALAEPAELAELVHSRHRGVGGGVGWRRLGGDSSARRHELWPSPKGQLTAGIGQLPSACGRLAAPSGRLGPSLARPAAVHSTRSASAHGTRGIGMELQVHIVAPLVQCTGSMGAACGRRTARDALCELLRRRRRCWWRRVDRRRAGLATICQRARNER